jgi:putative membrane protein
MQYYWEDGHMDDGWGIAMMLSMLGIWVVLTAAIGFAMVWTVRSTRAPQVASTVPPAAPAAGSGSVTGGAEKILAERLARGDIDTEEYRERLDALTPRSEP